MNKIKGNINLIVGLLVFVFIGFVAYNSFFKQDPEESIQEIQVGDENPVARKVISMLNDINKITFDTKFLVEDSDKNSFKLAFKDLKDFSIHINPKPAGKMNPFLPGGSISYSGDNSDSENMEDENTGDQNNTSQEQVQEEPIKE